MWLPLLWTPLLRWQINALPVLIGLTALVALFCFLLQVPFGYSSRRLLIRLIACAAAIEAILALIQLFFPLHAMRWLGYNPLLAQGRPLGGLRQVNLLGSFLATGLACSVWLMTSSSTRSIAKGWYLKVVNAFFSIPLLVALVLTHSRTGILGAALAIATLLIFSLAGRQSLQGWRYIALALVTGLLLAIYLLPGYLPHFTLRTPHSPWTDSHLTEPDKNAEGIFSLERMRQQSRAWRLQMLQGTWQMIKSHPLKGNGLGSFESLYPGALADAGLSKKTPKTVTHPHNELLLCWAEGGIVAVTGFGILFTLWLLPLRRRQFWQRYGRLLSLSLPLWLHIMTEFPLYLSAAHGLTLVLLLRIATPARLTKRYLPKSRWVMSVQKLSITLVASYAVLFMATAWQSQRILLHVERSNFAAEALLARLPNRKAQYDRVQFDLSVADLMRFNKTHNPAELTDFVNRASRFLQAHNDREMMDSLIRILLATHHLPEAFYWRQRAAQAFPDDGRFKTEGSDQ
ncbi:TPA: O-antigen ligase C-terminal domain-containing protein [Enterobacter roggenkampii]|nr:O-antigen ligase C-terminal domain-containing protein [Enterobacter roggenkampii]